MSNLEFIYPEFDINVWHKAQPNRFAEYNDGSRGIVLHQTASRIVCADGLTMSVQASETHYSSPRESCAWPYAAFEIGFPSMRLPELAQYADGDPKHCDVYGFVPAELINRIVREHGGLKDE